MRIAVIYEHGQLRFEAPIALRHSPVRLMVDIPDEEVRSEESRPTSPPSEVRKELDAILGPWRGKIARVSPEEDKRAWHEHLEEKYLR